MIADDLHPNARSPVIARPRRGRGNPFSRPFFPLEGVPWETLGRFPRALLRFLFCGGASGGPLSLPPKKAAKETAKGDLFRGGPLWNPSPTTKGAPPPSIPNGGRGTEERGRGRGTGVVGRGTRERERGLRIATTSDIGHWFRNDTILLLSAYSIRRSKLERYIDVLPL